MHQVQSTADAELYHLRRMRHALSSISPKAIFIPDDRAELLHQVGMLHVRALPILLLILLRRGQFPAGQSAATCIRQDTDLSKSRLHAVLVVLARFGLIRVSGKSIVSSGWATNEAVFHRVREGVRTGFGSQPCPDVDDTGVQWEAGGGAGTLILQHAVIALSQLDSPTVSVALAMWRKSQWSTSSRPMSHSYLAVATGMPKNTVIRAVTRCLELEMFARTNLYDTCRSSAYVELDWRLDPRKLLGTQKVLRDDYATAKAAGDFDEMTILHECGEDSADKKSEARTAVLRKVAHRLTKWRKNVSVVDARAPKIRVSNTVTGVRGNIKPTAGAILARKKKNAG